MTEPLASVIVLGWGGEPYIETCLRALERQTYPSIETIVVDNHSPDRTAEIVERTFPQVRLIHTERNLGVAGGNNVGLRAAQGDLCVLINADVEPHPDWMENLVRVLQSDPAIGIAGAKLLYPDGTIQFAGGRIEGPRGYTYHIGWHEPDKGQWDVPGDVDFITGASLAITHQALEQIGYEDEKFYPIDYEDPDLSYRARAGGYRVVLAPRAVAIHHESSTSRASEIGRVLPLEAGRVRFVCKHWEADRLRHEFLPAELEFLRKGPSLNRQVLRWAYLKTLRDLDDLVAWRARLGVGSRSESEAVLTEMLGQLRRAWYAGAGHPAPGNVDAILGAWFSPDPEPTRSSGPAADDRDMLLFMLSKMDGRVEPHQPIAWPEWPPGVWPKARALLQKVTRRLLRWYIDPIIEQQNEINATLLYAAETVAQEIALLRSHIGTEEVGDEPDPTGHAG